MTLVDPTKLAVSRESERPNTEMNDDMHPDIREELAVHEDAPPRGGTRC
jgi:hypothetical protein